MHSLTGPTANVDDFHQGTKPERLRTAWHDLVSGYIREQSNPSVKNAMAKIVGRWPDGSALARTPGHPDTDEATDMLRTNAVDYGHSWAEADVCSDPRVAREESGAFPPVNCARTPGT
jgi:hypothetical protein